MKKLIFLSLLVIVGFVFMSANRDDIGSNHTYAIVDTDPGALGYYTLPVNPKFITNKNSVKGLYFSIRGTFVQTITLQYKCQGDAAWTTYDSYTVAAGWANSGSTSTRVKIDDSGDGVQWKAGVINSAGYTSGTSYFGFDW